MPITANSNTATSVIDWTNTSYPIVQFSANGAAGTTGSTGLSSLTAYLQQNQASGIPATPSNTTGPTAPTGWSLTAPSTVTVGNVIWYTFGQYNGSSGTISGIPAGQTQWNVPVAASVFQDIRSDNWNGSTPPTPGTQSTYGTAGYYISRTNGSMWLNSVYGRGVATFDGYNSAPSGYSAAIVANTSLTQNAGVEAYTNNTFLSSGALRAFNSQSGAGNAIYGYQGGTGNAILGQSASGIGIKGTGNTGAVGTGTIGVEGDGGSGGYGVYGYNTSGSYAVYANGYYGTNNSTLVTNLYADLAKSLVGTTSNQLRFVSGTSTGSGVATFASTNKPGSTTTNVWMTIQIDATTLYIPVWT